MKLSGNIHIKFGRNYLADHRVKIDKEIYFYKPGLPKWEIAEKLPEILKLFTLAPTIIQQNP